MTGLRLLQAERPGRNAVAKIPSDCGEESNRVRIALQSVSLSFDPVEKLDRLARGTG
jgi:hypothetical protein